MSRRLITQLAENNPRVLLIGAASSLKQKIADYLARNSLDVVLVTTTAELQNQASQNFQNFYKVILLGNGLENSQFLANLPILRNLVVITLVSSMDTKQYLFDHEDQVVGLDVVGSASLKAGFERIFADVESGLLYDPQTDLFLQSEEAFLTALKQTLLLPKKEKRLIKGQKHSSQVVLGEVIRLLSLIYRVENLQTKELLSELVQLKYPGFNSINQETEALPSLLESLVKNGYHTRKTANISQIDRDDYHRQALSSPDLKKTVTEEKQPKTVPVKVVESLPSTAPQETHQAGEVPQSIDDQLQQIFKESRVEEKTEHVQTYVQETKKIKKLTKKKKILFGFGSLITIAASSLLLASGIFWFSQRQLERDLGQVFTNISQGVSPIDYSNLSDSSKFLSQQTTFYGQFLPLELISDADNLLEITKKISDYERLSTEYQATISATVQVALGKDLLQDSLDGQKQAKLAQSLHEVASKLLSRFHDLQKTKTSEKEQNEVGSFIRLIEEKKDGLITYQQLSPLLPKILGQDRKKTYALVFQNNQELRPTGGFVQAVAIVTVDQGMIVDYQVYSSYELDQKLGGAVVPPDEVLKLLGENKWYLRDSNWNPDFAQTGKQIAWFLEQEVDKKIDGVIGINMLVMQNFLHELGPVELAEYNEVINDKNLFERSEFHSEIKLVEGSAVEDYQTKLLKYLVRDILVKGQENPQQVLTALKKSVQEKQLTLYFKDETIAQAISNLGWSGEIIVPDCPTQLSTLPCQVDALVVNEANIGVNKANYHTSRQDTHEIELLQDQAKHRRTITLNNEAFSNAWPKGEYRAYFRFYLPSHAQAVSLNLDGQKVKEKEVTIAKQGDHLLLGLVVATPIKTAKTIELNYTIPLEFSRPFSYVFFSQKQPGTQNILQQVVLKHDANLSPTLIAPQAEVTGNAITFNNLVDDHVFIGVSFK